MAKGKASRPESIAIIRCALPLQWVHARKLAHHAVCLGIQGFQERVFGGHGHYHVGGFVSVTFLPLLVLFQYLMSGASLDTVLTKKQAQ